MTRPPVPLTAAQQQELVQQIGQAAAAALPAGWQQLQVVCRAAGRHVEVDVAVLAPDNRTYPVQPHPDLPRLLGVLRTGMYQPGRGTWLSATLVFSPQRPPYADYQPDVEPRWRQLPPPIGFQDELRFFPREDRFVPPWLRQRAGVVPGGVAGQPVPPPVPGANPAVPPPLPGAENAPPSTGPGVTPEQPSAPPPLPGQVPPPLPGAENPPPSTGSAVAPEPSTPPPSAGAENPPSSAGSAAHPERAADAEHSVPALPVDQPSAPPPLPGTENQPTSTADSVPGLPVDEPNTTPPVAATPPLPDLEQAASASDGDEAQSEPSEVAAAQIASQKSESEAVVPKGDSPGSPGELRTPRVYDGFDEAENPVVEREALSAEERERVLAYLDNAPVILASRSNDTDAFDPSRTDAVPLNFRTDGSWVWPGAVAYYLREHGISPDPELVGHIRAVGYTVPEVDEATRDRMLAAMTSPPAEESRPREAEPTADPEQLLGEISTALVAAAPQGWQRIAFDFMALGRHANLACGARMADGSTRQVPVARELSRPLAELRRSKYVRGRGTWYSLSLVVDPPSNYQASFNEDDEPAFHTPPRPEDYALDQELYPRDEDYLPLWFSARLPERPQ
ncbi:hypothetical protein [Streptomyces sp. AA4]|uniref:hypothetical protein n=1 Tax=Streptomyces sp. AA4 TaxID=591158 RepID=UPI0001B56BA8|nr:hypothetical protein [Streptomyces sp. AA4]EFL10836.1 hypothetical protein SSMG_06507 [Streptomyces sp. AA4]